jgi:hypothetical protein
MNRPRPAAAPRRDARAPSAPRPERGEKPRRTNAAALGWWLFVLSCCGNIFLLTRTTTLRDVPPISSGGSSLKTLVQTEAHRPRSSSAPSPAVLASAPVEAGAPPARPRTTAERSAAFSAYADLLAEDVKTSQQIEDLNELLARWVATAPADAALWLGRYDDAPFYDSAARHIALNLVGKQHFKEASAWAALIRDPALRDGAREAIVAESFRAKIIAAPDVCRSGLPADRVEAILNGARLD